MKKFTLRFGVALITFLLGLATTFVLRNYFSRKPQPLIKEGIIAMSQISKPTLTKESRWRTIIRDRFSFDLPDDMEPVFGYKEESGDRSYANGHGLQIIYWYGESCIYPIHPTKRRPSNEQVVVIDSVKARSAVDTFEGADLRVPYLCFYPTRARRLRLSMMAYAHSQEALETTEKIFKSVKFRN